MGGIFPTKNQQTVGRAERSPIDRFGPHPPTETPKRSLPVLLYGSLPKWGDPNIDPKYYSLVSTNGIHPNLGKPSHTIAWDPHPEP